MTGGLDEGRTHYEARRWRAAFDCLAAAEEPEDLERLATAAFLVGAQDAYFAALERAYHGYAARSATLDAARCARWIGLMRMRRGDVGQGSGWMARAARLVDEYGRDCVDTGYLMVPRLFEHEMTGELEAAAADATEIAEIGRRFGDRDLAALAVHSEGQHLIAMGRVAEGLARLDEAMVAVTTGELSPIVNGIVYCGVIGGCRSAHDVDRAAEWTSAMSRWCAEQPEMAAFAGQCRVHRAEILELRGSWPDALAEVDLLATDGPDPSTRGAACYVVADLHRLRGRYAEAEATYRRASEGGRTPQPGLALLRLATGGVQAAATMIGLALRDAHDPAVRPALLAAAVEILAASGDRDAAEHAAAELARLAAASNSRLLGAVAATAAGRLALESGDAPGALPALRAAAAAWQQLAAPYELARTRTLLGRALAQLGDADSAALEFDAARPALTRLGAAADLAALDAARGVRTPAALLTSRETEVLGLVAKGLTNRAIAAELVLSERTVDRHVSNIFTKIGVASRAAATAYALERRLV